MENEKWNTKNETHASNGTAFSELNVSINVSCPACGARTEREDAKFCRICGKLLNEGFQPLDNLRASYRLQGQNFSVEKTNTGESENLFETNKNEVSESAKALVVYSLVPYLGILFCPFAFMTGGAGAVIAYRKPYLGGGQSSFYAVIFSIVIFFFQIFLWWLLYFIPESGIGL